VSQVLTASISFDIDPVSSITKPMKEFPFGTGAEGVVSSVVGTFGVGLVVGFVVTTGVVVVGVVALVAGGSVGGIVALVVGGSVGGMVVFVVGGSVGGVAGVVVSAGGESGTHGSKAVSQSQTSSAGFHARSQQGHVIGYAIPLAH